MSEAQKFEHSYYFLGAVAALKQRVCTAFFDEVKFISSWDRRHEGVLLLMWK